MLCAIGVLGAAGHVRAQEGAPPSTALSAHAPMAVPPAADVIRHHGALSIRSRIAARDLVRVPGNPPMLHSQGAGAEAGVYHRMLQDGVAWFRAVLGHDSEILLAVLDAADYPWPVPYPTPFAEWASGLIVMPRHLDSHPGFDRWGLEAVPLNAALALHEAGHIIAEQTGRRPALRWLDELVANAFMAAFLQARHPELAAILAGVPPAFDDAGRLRRLLEFEALYFDMGQENYAWFQFHIARLAGYAVARVPLPELLDGIAAAFATHPQTEPDWTDIPGQIARLESVIPGIGEQIGALADVALPEVTPGPCPDSLVPPAGAELAILENRDPAAVLRYHRHGIVALALMIDALGQPGRALDPTEAEIRAAVADGTHAPEVLAPGAAAVIRWGDLLYLEDGRCLVASDAPSARLVWTAP
ncbi:MAG: hypothetical protein JJU42_06725 [Rhodobacteraceae bacterium]|nr:hypothetical protein [Paracoccaceae bacterium]